MNKDPPCSPNKEPKPIGHIFQDPDSPGFVFIVTEHRSWRVDGYILEKILNTHMQGINNSEIDAPNPFIDESIKEEDWEKRKGKRSRYLR